MTPSFVLSARAKRDLRKAKAESLKIWNSEQTNIYNASIESRLMWLAENPQLGKPRDEVREGLRSFSQGRHVIFYRTRVGAPARTRTDSIRGQRRRNHRQGYCWVSCSTRSSV